MPMNFRSQAVSSLIQSYFLLSLLLVLLILSQPTKAAALDHDGDGKADLTLFSPRPVGYDPASWEIILSGSNVLKVYQWGNPSDTPVPGFYTGGQGADIAVWRSSTGTWYIRQYDSSLKFAQASAYSLGAANDSAQPCDFDGDGKTDLAVWRSRNATWYVRPSAGSTPFSTAYAQVWGSRNDTPIPADYDADGKCDYAVFRKGKWYAILSSENNQIAGSVAWGSKGDIPVPGYYVNLHGVGDNVIDFAVYRPKSNGKSLWAIRLSNLGGLTSRSIEWGTKGDIPAPADYDGDGKTDIAVFKPSKGRFDVLLSSSNYTSAGSYAQQLGARNDIPIGDRRGK